MISPPAGDDSPRLPHRGFWNETTVSFHGGSSVQTQKNYRYILWERTQNGKKSHLQHALQLRQLRQLRQTASRVIKLTSKLNSNGVTQIGIMSLAQ